MVYWRMSTKQFSGEEFKFVAFADSHDITTPSLADLKPPT